MKRLGRYCGKFGLGPVVATRKRNHYRLVVCEPPIALLKTALFLCLDNFAQGEEVNSGFEYTSIKKRTPTWWGGRYFTRKRTLEPEFYSGHFGKTYCTLWSEFDTTPLAGQRLQIFVFWLVLLWVIPYPQGVNLYDTNSNDGASIASPRGHWDLWFPSFSTTVTCTDCPSWVRKHSHEERWSLKKYRRLPSGCQNECHLNAFARRRFVSNC